jgi:ribonuclease PH
VAAVSCGIVGGLPLLDLDYGEDSRAEADANFVLTASGGIVEVQATAEHRAFPPEQLAAMMTLARSGVERLLEMQRKAVGLGAGD